MSTVEKKPKDVLEQLKSLATYIVIGVLIATFVGYMPLYGSSAEGNVIAAADVDFHDMDTCPEVGITDQTINTPSCFYRVYTNDTIPSDSTKPLFSTRLSTVTFELSTLRTIDLPFLVYNNRGTCYECFTTSTNEIIGSKMHQFRDKFNATLAGNSRLRNRLGYISTSYIWTPIAAMVGPLYVCPFFVGMAFKNGCQMFIKTHIMNWHVYTTLCIPDPVFAQLVAVCGPFIAAGISLLIYSPVYDLPISNGLKLTSTIFISISIGIIALVLVLTFLSKSPAAVTNELIEDTKRLCGKVTPHESAGDVDDELVPTDWAKWTELTRVKDFNSEEDVLEHFKRLPVCEKTQNELSDEEQKIIVKKVHQNAKMIFKALGVKPDPIITP